MSILCLSSWESSSLVSEVVCCVECVLFNCHCCSIIVSIVFQAYLHVVDFVRVRCYAQCPWPIMGRCRWSVLRLVFSGLFRVVLVCSCFVSLVFCLTYLLSSLSLLISSNLS